MLDYGCSNERSKSVAKELKERVLAHGKSKNDDFGNHIKEQFSYVNKRLDILLEDVTVTDAPSLCTVEDRGFDDCEETCLVTKGSSC